MVDAGGDGASAQVTDQLVGRIDRECGQLVVGEDHGVLRLSGVGVAGMDLSPDSVRAHPVTAVPGLTPRSPLTVEAPVLTTAVAARTE